MTSIIENEVLEELIGVFEHHLNSLRNRRLVPGKAETIRQMEDTLSRARACLPQEINGDGNENEV